MSIASIALPRILRIGGGASKQLAEVLATLGLARPLIVTDGWLVSSGRIAELVDGLAAAGIAARVFADTVPDPTVASVDAGVAYLLEGDHDCVVGFGGGSPLDSAKAIALLGNFGGAMADYKAPHVQDAGAAGDRDPDDRGHGVGGDALHDNHRRSDRREDAVPGARVPARCGAGRL